MLRRFLPSVVAHTPPVVAEVVVADNGSTDDSLSVLESEFPSVRVIRLEQNYGFAEGYNRALQQVSADYTVLLNSDVEVTADWLTPMLTYLDAHPETAACQPKILSWHSLQKGDRPVLFEHAGAAGGKIDALGYPFCRGRMLSYVEADRGQYDTIEPVFWASGAALCIRTQVYRKTGGLDRDFFAHMEEIDLCWRLQCRGYQLVCVPQSVVYHVGDGALAYTNPRKTYLNFRNNLLMLYKNLPAWRLVWVLCARLLLDYVAALQFLLTGQTTHARSVVKARWDFLRMACSSTMRQRRKQNLRAAVVNYPQTIQRRSMLFDYYLHSLRQ